MLFKFHFLILEIIKGVNNIRPPRTINKVGRKLGEIFLKKENLGLGVGVGLMMSVIPKIGS